MNIPAAIRFPSIPLADALRFGDLLYKSAGRTPVDTAVAVKAIGYSSSSGAARSTMSAMSSYGIISKSGGNYRISDECLKHLRPVAEQDRMDAARSMALKPELFKTIYMNHRECNEQVLASLLLHQGLVEDSAKKAAHIYKVNSAFTKLDEGPYLDSDAPLTENQPISGAPSKEVGINDDFRALKPSHVLASIPNQNVLAQYSIPLGDNEAKLVFTGKTLVPEDFDALGEYVGLFKKQFERRQKKDT